MSTPSARRGRHAILPGAVVYPPGTPVEDLFAGFTGELAARGWRLGGLIQRTERDADGRKTAMDLIELDTGRRIAIGQSLGRDSESCILDVSGLAEGTEALRRAMAEDADLLVLNKFSQMERQGGGLADEMLQAMAEGFPLLTGVPADVLGDWLAFTGGHCRLLAPDLAALWRWWGAHRLYRDLFLGVPDDEVRRVVVGVNWTMVEGPHGVGLAQTPARQTAGCRRMPRDWRGRSLRDLASLIEDSWDAFDAAVAMAAINAHYNRRDLAGADANGLDIIAEAEGRVVAVGGFPGLGKRRADVQVIERAPGEGHFPEEAAEWLLPGCEVAVVTASTLANRSLPHLLELAQGARVALVGPGCCLSPRLFAYGVAALSGLVGVEADGLAAAGAVGAAGGALKAFGRQPTLLAP